MAHLRQCFSEQDTQCHAHGRETEKKPDHVGALYRAVGGLLVTNDCVRVSDLPKLPSDRLFVGIQVSEQGARVPPG